jgi:cysteine desulfurase
MNPYPPIYLDHNATTPVRPEVLEAMLPYYRERFGNPSSIHWAGRQVKGAVEEAREQVARLVNCLPVEVVFTSCGSEADNMAIKGVASASRQKGNHIITTRVEHPAVLQTCQHLEREGCEVTWLEVDRFGLPDLAALEAAVCERTILISAMLANNETGTVLPVEQIGEIAVRHKIPFHCDAVQALGKIPVDCRAIQAGLLALSGHKIGAPKGVGALVVRTGTRLHPLLHGGAQERNRRAGTENVPGIVAFGKACALAAAELAATAGRMAALRDRLEEGILRLIPGVTVNGHREHRLPNTSNLSFSGAKADSLLLSLDLEGIAASSGSACSSGTLKASPVLAAMGVAPEDAAASVRFSLGAETTEGDLDRVLALLPGIVERLRSS